MMGHPGRDGFMGPRGVDQWRPFVRQDAPMEQGRYRGENKYMDDMPMDQNQDSRDIKKKKERGMSRLRMRRGPGRSGKLTKSGLDMQSFFKTKICPYLLSGHCTKGEKCSFAHSQEELKDPPNLKKTKVCQQFTLGKCQMGAKCSYAHGESELRYTPEFFKTSLCKSFMKGNCSLGDKCRYAHGEEDLRMPTILEDQTVSIPTRKSNMMIPKQMPQTKQEDIALPQQMSFGNMGFGMMGGQGMRLSQSQTDEILQSFNISSVSHLNLENK